MSSPKKKRNGIIFIVSGPSGSGKTTLCHRLLSRKAIKGSLVKTVSVTTRERRKGERQHRDYRFVTNEEFLKMKASGQLLESQQVFGSFYGTPKDYVEQNLKKGIDVLLCIDVKGAQEVKKIYPTAYSIFIMPPSIEALRHRLQKRSSETKDSMSRRFRLAKREMALAKNYDYTIINDELLEATNQLEAAIITERARRGR